MPRWLADPAFSLYLVLILAVLVSGGVLLLRRDRRSLILAMAIVSILIVLFLIDTLFQSGRERAISNMQTMAAATRSKTYPTITNLVTNSFAVRGINKANLPTKLKSIDQQYGWQGAEVWDFDRTESSYPDDKTVIIGFSVKATGFNALLWSRATFRHESDGEWRLHALEFYDPLKRTNDPPIAVPGL